MVLLLKIGRSCFIVLIVRLRRLVMSLSVSSMLPSSLHFVQSGLSGCGGLGIEYSSVFPLLTMRLLSSSF